MTPATLRSRLGTRVVGRHIEFVDRCTSTNDLAWKAAGEGAVTGTVIFAEQQAKGRGRFGRQWQAARGRALLCSTVLRPSIGPDRITLMTAMAALGASDAVGAKAQIRFPNDVMLGGKKIAGVLVEARFTDSRPEVIIVGVGLNVTGHPRGVGATSLGPEASRLRTARALMRGLDRWYGRLSGSLREYRREWRDRSFIMGKRVRVREAGRRVTGVVEEVDPLEGIVLRLESGHLRPFRGERLEHLEVL